MPMARPTSEGATSTYITRVVAPGAGGCAVCAAALVAIATRPSLTHAFVNPLIEQCSRERSKRVAEFLRVVRNGVRVQRLLVSPELDDGEMVVAVRLHRGQEDRVSGL